MNERATALVTILLVEDSDDSRQVLKAGCNEYIVKPIDFDVLEDTVRRLTSGW